MASEMVPLRRSLLLLVVSLAAAPFAACVSKDSEKNPEFAGQGDALDIPVSTAKPAPTQAAVRIGAPVAAAGVAADLPAKPGPGSTYALAACPADCYIADGARRIPVPQQELDALRAAFGPTLSGLRQCAATGGMDDERHKPTINLRFGPRGELMDVGVDPTGWDAQTEDCMQQVARGAASAPQVSIDGPADVRCSEKCERHGRWTTPPR